MKRNTQDLVKEAADKLLREGVKPTQQNIRDCIGTGSITTINKALSAWWSELGVRLDEVGRNPSIPEPVANSAHKLWMQALAYASKELDEQRSALENEFAERARKLSNASVADNGELKELRAQCLRLLQDNERLSSEKGEGLLKVAECETRLIESQAEISRLTRELKQAEIMSEGSSNIDQYIEVQVENRTLQEENKRLNRAVDALVGEKAELQLEVIKLKQMLSES
ncbi:DNA-binding protein [Neptuniibacter sp. QD37_6]|uniref:DNA-binding protein n=1 Tax=Neptuniibacter sp. QD37_6 TaxID=3398210 RepID=UPI0039F56368